MVRPLRILLAEDNPLNQTVFSRMLQKQGHAVEVVGNGKEALASLEHRQFDLVFMDVQMPELDGVAAAAAIRARERAAGERVPIVAMTAHSMKEDRHRCLEAGMDAYVEKPVDPGELSQTIESLLAAGPLKSAAPPQEGRPSPPAFDGGALLTRFGGDMEFIRRLADLFRQQLPTLLSSMKEAAQQSDTSRLLEAAHTLKGSLGHFHAAAAQDAAARVERTAADGDWTGFEQAYAALGRELLNFDAALAAPLESDGR